MPAARTHTVVLMTAPDLKTARSLARSAVRARLAACANLVPGIESHYWWQGRLEQGTEVLVIFKTTRLKLAALERHVLARHPYDTPEFLALPLAAGSQRYLAWLTASVAEKPARPRAASRR
jgi:periplasmic divalent cation tolerance protein